MNYRPYINVSFNSIIIIIIIILYIYPYIRAIQCSISSHINAPVHKQTKINYLFLFYFYLFVMLRFLNMYDLHFILKSQERRKIHSAKERVHQSCASRAREKLVIRSAFRFGRQTARVSMSRKTYMCFYRNQLLVIFFAVF
jgi:hypothetical protein